MRENASIMQKTRWIMRKFKGIIGPFQCIYIEHVTHEHRNTGVQIVLAIFVRHFEAFSNEGTLKTNERSQRKESVNKRPSWLTLATRLTTKVVSRLIANRRVECLEVKNRSQTKRHVFVDV